MAKLILTVENQSLSVSCDIPKIVENSIDYLTYSLKTSSDWAGYDTQVLFTHENETFIGLWNKVPKEVIKAPGFVVTVLGKIAEGRVIKSRIPSSPVPVKVYPSGELKADKPSEEDFTEDWYDEVVKTIENFINSVDQDYNSESENPQSGKAVTQGLTTLANNTRVGVILGSSGTKKELTYTQDGARCIIHFWGKLAFRAKGVLTSGLDWNTISDDIADYIEISGETANITLPDYNRCLVYNVMTGQLEIKKYADITINDIVLIINGYGAPCGGELMRYIDSIGVSQKEEVCVTQSGVYLTGANPVIKYSSYGSNGGTDIKLSGDLRIYYGDTHYSRDWANGVSEDFIAYADSIATITIPDYGDKFVFNIQDKALHIRKRKDANVVGDIILIANGYAVPCGGALLRYVNAPTSEIAQLQNTTNNLQTNINNLQTEIKDFNTKSGAYFATNEHCIPLHFSLVKEYGSITGINFELKTEFRVWYVDSAKGIKDIQIKWDTHLLDDYSLEKGSITIADSIATITVNVNSSFVFNTSDSKLHFKYTKDITSKDIVLLTNGYRPCDGALLRYFDMSGLDEKESLITAQSGIYLSGTEQSVTYKSYGSSGGLEITIKEDLVIYYGNKNKKFQWGTTGNTVILNGYGYKYVFNTIDDELYVRTKEETVVGDIVLILNGYSVPCGGALLRYVNATNTSAGLEDIQKLQQEKENIIITQSGLYLGSAGADYAVTWEQVPKSETLKITIPELIKFRVSDKSIDMSSEIAKGRTWSHLSTNLKDVDGNSLITIEGNSATITIPRYGQRLVFNVDDSQFYIRERKDNIVNDIVLMVNGYGTPCGGELMRYIDLGRIMNLEESVEKMKNSFSTIEENTRNKVMEYSALFNNTTGEVEPDKFEPFKVEPFLFFTDPHLTQHPGDNWRSEFNTYMSSLANTYNEAPVERVFCGGDWLGEREYNSEACYRLGLIDSTMRKFFKKYHLVVGNHDTNYQGCGDDYEQTKPNRYTTKLTNDTIENLWARNTGKLYYKVESDQTDFYVLDTNAPNNDTEGIWDTDYLNEQWKWFASELQNNKRGNLAVMVHIFLDFKDKNGDDSYDTSNPSVQDCSQPIADIVGAFNTRSSAKVGGEIFNFNTVTTGEIRFIMCGHKHVDCVTKKFAGGTPVIATTHLRDGNIPTYDLCLANYTNNTLELVRVGTGSNRKITLSEFGNDTTDLLN